MGHGEVVNTSDFDSDTRGFKSHCPSFGMRRVRADQSKGLYMKYRKAIDFLSSNIWINSILL